MTEREACRIRSAVLDELFRDRRGLKHAWGDITAPIKREIRQAVLRRIREAVEPDSAENGGTQ